MSCEKDIRLPVNTEIIYDEKNNPIGLATNNPVVINQLETRLEGSSLNVKPKEVGIYLNAE